MSPYIYFNPNPLVSSLEKNWQQIRSELYGLLKIRGIVDKNNNFIRNNEGKKPNALNTLYAGNFKSLCLYIRKNLLDKFEMADMNWQLDEQERYSPHIRQMSFLDPFIAMHKSNIGSCVFNVSYPGSTLKHHFGLDPDYIRLHLCIKEDQHCVFDIENHRHVWKEGEVFGFDDANVLHGTRHFPEGRDARIIMLMDVKKDYLRPYAKTWPCRESRPKLSEIPKLTGWDKPIETFVKND